MVELRVKLAKYLLLFVKGKIITIENVFPFLTCFSSFDVHSRNSILLLLFSQLQNFNIVSSTEHV